MQLRKLLNAPLVRGVRKVRYDRLFATANGIGCYRGVYPSFDAAKAAAPPALPLGYDTAEAAEMYRDRLAAVFPSDYPMLFWLRDILPGATQVFDLGGHVGVTYYAYRKFLPYPDGLQWTVCDVSAVVESGEALAATRGATALRFTTSRDAASGASVYIAAGSLQYLEEPIDEIVAALEQPPRHILINKTPTHAAREYVTLQNIGVTFCPYRIAHENAIPESLARLGYELVDRWVNADLRCEVPFDDEANPVTYVGYYFRLRSAH